MEGYERKAWGWTKPVVVKDVFQEHNLVVEAGGYCSVHWHEHRANKFIVHSGRIAVVVFNGWTWKRRVLTSGDIMNVPSKVVHRFEVYQDGKVTEEYWPDRSETTISTDDIVRIVVGGKLDVNPTINAFDEIIHQHIRASL